MKTDKFITINYRHADNSRHAMQLEQFYIDALKAISVDVVKFAADNAGESQVTRNVKRAIVNELVKRATVSPVQPIPATENKLNIIQDSELNIIQDSELNITQQVNDIAPAKTTLDYVSDGRCTIRTKKGAYCTKPDYNNSGYCKQHYKNLVAPRIK